ncbi:hypothetical protein J2T17_004608 [Paenibacillus mucilaginosus]|uniref:hypothetical protein n=1 Tax=Paenibacillus mucilaginosus TaxID=61624 RepID=UPI003D25A144
MSLLKPYLKLWFPFVLAVTAAALGLESIEGYKIKTTEYYGLMNLGADYFLVIIIMVSLPSLVLYPLIGVPVSLIMRRWIGSAAVRTVLYAWIGVLGGMWFFNENYLEDMVVRFDLRISTAAICFGMAGLFYALLEHFLISRLGRELGFEKLG